MDDFFDSPAAAGAAQVEEFVYSLARKYPFARAVSLGASVCGRPICALELGAMHNPAMIVGGTHGMEWASVLCALRLAHEAAGFVDECAHVCGVALCDALERRGAVFVPLLNPDGYELRRRGAAAAANGGRTPARFCGGDFRYWQANANGVDLNRNFAAGFAKARRAAAALGIKRPAPTRYGGLFPFSEPETRAIRRACAKYRPRALYTLHSQGEEIYWLYGDKRPAGSDYIAKTLAALSGYARADPDPVAVGAGLKDWFIKRYDRPGFTLELGLGRNPLPYEDFPAIYEKIRRALLVAMII